MVPDSDRVLVDRAHVYEDLSSTAEDCCLLPQLTPFAVLRNLELRYGRGEYLTFVSDVLLSINPCGERTRVPLTVDPNATLHSLVGTMLTNVLSRLTKAPQTFVISGDAGAGKTEMAKRIMASFSHTLQPQQAQQLHSWLDIIHPVAESFGNAATKRNVNSSRYGRLTRLALNGSQVAGLETTPFLLERRRVLQVVPSESTFHILCLLETGQWTTQLRRGHERRNRKERSVS